MDNAKYNWGIAMEGCEEAIIDAIELANKEVPVGSAKTFNYIEIGVAEGKTLTRICDYLYDNEIDFLAIGIDIENGWSLNIEKFYENTEVYGENVILDLTGSPQALKKYEDNSICAILIDGDHTKEAVINDFKEADRIIAKGGVIMFHDSAPEDQQKDDFERQIHGIEVRAAIEELGLLNGENKNYKILTDISGDKEKNGRGIFIVQKK